ncbi:MAG: NTF2 fold immunity protein [Bacteroidota bacterium]
MKQNLLIAFLIAIFLLTNQSCNRNNNNNSKINESKRELSKTDSQYKILGQNIAKKELDRFLKDSTYNLFKGEVLINDEQTLIKIVEPILFNIYGQEQIVSERPYETYLFDDYWLMRGTLPKGMKGGTFSIAINRKTCEVIGITHGK